MNGIILTVRKKIKTFDAKSLLFVDISSIIALSSVTRLTKEEVIGIESVLAFLVAVLANVCSHIICELLDLGQDRR